MNAEQAIETIRAQVERAWDIGDAKGALAALDLLTAQLDRAEQAEKARAEIERRWRERHARADEYDDTGAHDAARHTRAVAIGLGEARVILETALKESESDSNSQAGRASGGETG